VENKESITVLHVVDNMLRAKDNEEEVAIT
jgi:hypothetical protein